MHTRLDQLATAVYEGEQTEAKTCRYSFKIDNTADIDRFPLFSTHWIVLWMERSYSIPTPRIGKERRNL